MGDKKLSKMKPKVKANPSKKRQIPVESSITDFEHHDEKVLEKPTKILQQSSTNLEQVSTTTIDYQTRLEQLLAASRVRKQSFWGTVCNEIDAELSEIDLILTKFKLPPYHYRKDKTFTQNIYDSQQLPNTENCCAKDYLDCYIFPYLLSAIENMILYARKNRVFQCRADIFNPLDYIVEYLYNNNIRYPQRIKHLVPLAEIPFVAQWLRRYPRPAYPRWLTMSEEEAAIIIQRFFRMWLARRKRQEYKIARDKFRKKKCLNKFGELCGEDVVLQPIFPPYFSEMTGESADELITHSHDCFVCNRLRIFLQQEELKRELRMIGKSSIREHAGEGDY